MDFWIKLNCLLIVGLFKWWNEVLWCGNREKIFVYIEGLKNWYWFKKLRYNRNEFYFWVWCYYCFDNNIGRNKIWY